MLNLEYIKYEIHDDGIAFINLNREPVNAINLKLLKELDKVIDDIKKTSKCRLVIFRSLQKHFCAGADLVERKGMSKNQTLIFLEKINNLFDKIEHLEIPTICSINGAALGGGLELALCCDFRVANQKAVLGLTETSLGIIPGAGGVFRLSNLIGLSKAKYWIYTAQKFSSENAYFDGLIDFIADNDELLGVTLELSQEILENAPLAIKGSKKMLNTFSDREKLYSQQLKEYLKVIDSNDKKEGLKAFSEKKKPKWNNN